MRRRSQLASLISIRINMGEELRLFRDLVLMIWDHHRKPWLWPRGQAKDIYIGIATPFQSFADRSELEASLPTEEQVRAEFPPWRFLYLEPVTHGQVLVPVLSMKCDFGRSIPEVRVRLGLFLRHNRDIKAIGYRFEAPEGPGIHHYYHLQMIRGLRTSLLFPPADCLKWMPDAAPTFPLDVDGSVKLLLGLLISLYGVGETVALLRHASFGAQTRRYLSAMNCYSFPPFEWYWKVAIGSTPNRYEYYRTAKDPQEFRDHFSRLYSGCQITGVTESEYSALSKSKRKIYK